MFNPKITVHPTKVADKVLVKAVGFLGETSMVLPISVATFQECWDRRVAGDLIQNAFPMLNAEQREFLLTGMTTEQQEETFDHE